MYDLFYDHDPRISDPDFEWIAVKEVYGRTVPSFWHCLTDDKGLETLPFGSFTFWNIPLRWKTQDGDPLHSFAGRNNMRGSNGGFDVTEK